MDQLFRICYSMKFWLDLDPKNVAIVYCNTGKMKTGLIIACYLVYTGRQDNGFDALRFFFSKRFRNPDIELQDLPSLSASFRVALLNFHSVMALEGLPNRDPLFLSALLINALSCLLLLTATSIIHFMRLFSLLSCSSV